MDINDLAQIWYDQLLAETRQRFEQERFQDEDLSVAEATSLVNDDMWTWYLTLNAIDNIQDDT